MISDEIYVHTGGYGTLEELLEVITWAQLGIHDKPVNSLHILYKFEVIDECDGLLNFTKY